MMAVGGTKFVVFHCHHVVTRAWYVDEMNHSLTDLTIILDRSGSMQAIREAMEESLMSMLRRQAGEPGKLLVSLVRFDDIIETVFTAIDASNVRPIFIEPRNCTALLDAVGLTIDSTGQRLATLSESDRPGCVIIVVVTDGLENASRRFTVRDVQDRIRHQTEQYKWQFIFLGANIDAIATAGQLGISSGNALDVSFDRFGIECAIDSLGKGVAAKRKHFADNKHSPIAKPAPAAFDEEDRKRQKRDRSQK